MRTVVANLKVVRVPGPTDVYIGRVTSAPGGFTPERGGDGRFGNPTEITTTATRSEAIDAFARYFHERVATDPGFRAQVLTLRGKRLLCFCSPKPCHGDVIAAWVNNQDYQDQQD